MPWPPRIFRRSKDEDELDEELRFDLAEETRLRIERGESPEEAAAGSRRDLGNLTVLREDARRAWGWTSLERLLLDLRYACRTLRHSPTFTAAAVGTLGLGIGICCFLFSWLNGLVLQPLPGARDPRGLWGLQASVSYPEFESYRDETGVTSSMSAFLGPAAFSVGVEPGSEPERIFGHLISPDYFSTVGVEPLLGRFFDAETERPGAEPAVVVSERFWRTRLGADPHAAGRELRINGRPATLLGVAREGFVGVFPINPADIFLPLSADPSIAPELADGFLTDRNRKDLHLVFRLAPGVTEAQAEAALEVLRRRWNDEGGELDPNQNKRARKAALTPAGGIGPWPREFSLGSISFFGLLMALILSFTCANLAGLTLARGAARGREIAIRLSLGAGRWRIVRQLLTESVLLALTGGALGLATAWAMLKLVLRSVGQLGSFPPPLEVTPDWNVALLTFAVAALAGAGFGLTPALAATRTDVASALKKVPGDGLRRKRWYGLRNVFMVYQLTAAMTLVIMMAFLVAGIRSGGDGNPGVDVAGLSVFSLDPARDGLPPDEAAAALAGLPERLRLQEGVEAAALAHPRLFQSFATPDANVTVPVHGTSAAGEPDPAEAPHRVALRAIGPGLFAAMGAPMLRGTEFSERELRSERPSDMATPAILNHTAAEELFGDADPLGKAIRQDERVYEVVGVVQYGAPAVFSEKAAPLMLQPLTMSDLRRTPAMGLTVLVRGRGGILPADLPGRVERIDGRLTVFRATSFADQLAQMTQAVQSTTAIYGSVGLFALILACVGLAGLTAQAALRRRKEIGIRVALGARVSQVMSLVMHEGAAMILAGGVFGALGALAISRFLASINEQYAQVLASGVEPSHLLAGPLALFAVAAAACYLPARRAAQADPLDSLREE
ncbi:MAG: FtsX-like permease family protein [Acidobacteria bacterium]|nr:FtsX-like permease family protein [Acidobacteriota bacterium]